MMTIPKDNYDWMNAYNKAVEVIKKHNFEADNAVEYVETLAALEAIITGLNEMAKSIQYSEDCVSRNAILALSEWYGESATYDNPFPDGAEAVPVYKIEQLPSVHPKRPTGKWIVSYPDGARVFKCNQCNKYADIHHATYYCPNCGAKMEEKIKLKLGVNVADLDATMSAM